jgi:hypothetical protein
MLHFDVSLGVRRFFSGVARKNGGVEKHAQAQLKPQMLKRVKRTTDAF